MDEITELLNIVKENNSDTYQKVIEERAFYPCLYHLSEARENLIRSLPLKKGKKVLELHAECGALTGKLLEMTGNVTAVTENEETAAIIRERLKDRKGLRVVNRKEVTVTDTDNLFKETYDVILLVGRTYEAIGYLSKLKNFLTKDGSLFLADANRFGLKYFAGCAEEYGGTYFSGVEGYPDGGIERCYTKKEYEKLLEENGFEIFQWYYPYPDYKFPSVLYSDVCQPGQGELADNRRNFDRDRYLLFEEKRVFDSVLSEGLFPEFSNSFLIEAKLKKKTDTAHTPALWETSISGKSEIRAEDTVLLYAKYSDERVERFAIRTDIIAETRKKVVVYKYPLYSEGKSHISHIGEAYHKLKEHYKNPGISFCRCEIQEDAVCFPFVEGMTLADVMEDALHRRDNTAVREILVDYIQRMSEDGGKVPFVETEEFREVFGAVLLPEGIEAQEICDIDLIFPNILVSKEDVADGKRPRDYQWNIIDYEWTFFFPIPKKFILYRALYFTYYQILNDTEWTLRELMELAEITEPMQQTFMEMERQFQRYLGKDTLPVRNMQRRLGTKIISLKELSGEKQETELFIREEEWMKVRKIRFHIDRADYQDGSVVCSGWAFAKVRDGRTLPVHIRVTDMEGKEIVPEIHRNRRSDVAETFRLRRVTNPDFGFDCVWIAPPGEKWKLHFSLGRCEKSYETAAL
ncbi:MAG: hypothetical protein PUA75_02100 [Clostridiales bacterium]|nr:hypothetical protein [Clostridiales bacterium]